MFRNYRLRDYDFKLILMVSLLAAIGVVAIGSAEESLQQKQMFGAIAGFVMMIGLSFQLSEYSEDVLADLRGESGAASDGHDRGAGS